MAAAARFVRGFGLFWWDFIVGDDWRLAVGVVVALAVTAGLGAAGIPSWWFLPVAVLTLLTISLRLAARRARSR
jgi:hypothetical protein